MTVDPRLPVLVGVGQTTHRDGDAPAPVALLEVAARRAFDDGGAAGLPSVLDAVWVVRTISQAYRDPGALLAERLGARPRHTAVSGRGGQSPQALVNRAADLIRRGDLDVVLIGGVECWRTRMSYQRRDEQPPWTGQGDDIPIAEVLGSVDDMTTDVEEVAGFRMPVQAYPLFENALRARAGRGVEEHRRRIAELWARFNDVATRNPHAAIRQPLSASQIGEPSEGNRFIGFPYTKRECANNMVDQAAALVVCSAEKAATLGVPRDRWVFLHSGTAASDTAFVSNRWDLDRSPAVRIAGGEALTLAGCDVDDLAHVDLYSCFPVAVQVGAAELGLSLDRQLTVTGGLTFAGGPWNDYVTHALATLVQVLRDDPGSSGLCWANGGLLTKHAFGVYSTDPPAGGVRLADLQERVDAGPSREVAADFTGSAPIESYTVMHDRDGEARQGLCAFLVDGGRRAWGCVEDRDTLRAMTREEFCGRPATVGPGGAVEVG